MKREDRITKDCCSIKWKWDRKRIQGLENYGYYVVIVKKSGYQFPQHFSSKKAASAWLGKLVRCANMIRAGQIADPRNKD